MKTSKLQINKKSMLAVGTMALLGASLLVAAPQAGYADGAYSMAPPVSAPETPADLADDNDTSASTVFSWQEVPANQEVPITRAVFDQGGYQLFDTQGETIVVKFTNNNLYVMKFAVSKDDTMYFVNSGTSPILYVPKNGYLENATVSGARWYPFTPDFQPETPVFLGVAPSWNDYCNIGWYPDMYCYGGYWGDEPYGYAPFEPSFGLFIAFGGHHFDGWGGYIGFADLYPAPFRIGFYNDYAYRFAGRGYWGGRQFRGGYGGHGYRSYGHDFAGVNHGYDGGGRGFGGGDHVFRGADGYGGVQGYHTSDSYHSNFAGGFRGSDTVRSGGFGGGYHTSDGNRGGFRSSDTVRTGGFGGGGDFRGGNFGGGGGFRSGSSGGGHGSFGGGSHGGDGHRR